MPLKNTPTNINDSTIRTDCNGLQVAQVLHAFIENEVLPQTGIQSIDFWRGFSAIVADLAPKNLALLKERDRLQAEIDGWYKNQVAAKKSNQNISEFKCFLQKIGYLAPANPNIAITTVNVDSELAQQAGPQLVVPVLNARYALNAANARWGSLFDALYGTDAIFPAAAKGVFDAARADQVIAFSHGFLDAMLPLDGGVLHKHTNGMMRLRVENGQVVPALSNPNQFVGYQGDVHAPSAMVFVHNGLHIELQFKPDGSGNLHDVILEAALSAILDLEDSVAVVDADDKVLAYRNWLGILKGTLIEKFEKNGEILTRGLNSDRQYTGAQGQNVRLHGRALLFVRNVGHLMTNPAILYPNPTGTDVAGEMLEIPEGILDAVVTVLIALHDINRPNAQAIGNSRTKSIYIVKPKMHGPAEVAFANLLFGRVEALLKLPKNTVKLGIMDEERRTSVNLTACIAAAQERVAFINTGFLDRTGDEMHTAMHAGAMVRKADMKTSTWIAAYEQNNVATGLACGLSGKAQIGKGMWAMPDLMGAMLAQKINHPKAGANTAWVPSPTAATLHAMHYHHVDVFAVQKQLRTNLPNVDDLLMGLLQVPVATEAEKANWHEQDIQNELDNNVQGILGYVVRWIDQGVGCSKVPDIHGVGLMEDRATLRISSQHIANWLLHGIVSSEQVRATFERMARVVDLQNAKDASYKPMAKNRTNSQAYQAAVDLVFKGLTQPNGYTEPLLHAWRLRVKQDLASQNQSV